MKNLFALVAVIGLVVASCSTTNEKEESVSCADTVAVDSACVTSTLTPVVVAADTVVVAADTVVVAE